MAGRRIVYGGAPTSVSASEGCSNPNSILLQNPRVPCSSEPIDSLILAGASPSFLGSRSMVSFEDINRGKRSDRPFFCSFDQGENVDEEMDEYFHQPEKKRRLLPDQVQFLERSFEVDNKLEPERKIQLAKDLGLQPRQVAIWFQNRRARWKTKQLEKDYSALESCYNSLKADYDGLLKEKEKLKSEVLLLTDKLRLKQKQEGNSEQLDSKNQQSQPPVQTPMDSLVGCCKQEELSSAKSDVLDSESPCYIDGGHSALLEPGDSSYALEPDQSDLSQDEEDNLSKNLLPPPEYVFPKIEDCDYPTNPPANSCYFSFPVDDQTFGFWSD